MMKVIVTLRDQPATSVEIPEATSAGGKLQAIERSCFGAIRLFPDVPKAISKSELDYLKVREPALFRRLFVQPYVESHRIDRRGMSEAEVNRRATRFGFGHLPHAKQVAALKKSDEPDES